MPRPVQQSCFRLCPPLLYPLHLLALPASSQTLQRVVSSCNSYLQDGRDTWRHNSVLLHIARTLSSVANSSLFADLPNLPSPSLITGDSSVYVLELTVDFESSININSDRTTLSLFTSRVHIRLLHLLITFHIFLEHSYKGFL